MTRYRWALDRNGMMSWLRAGGVAMGQQMSRLLRPHPQAMAGICETGVMASGHLH